MSVVAIERPQIGKGLKDAHNIFLTFLVTLFSVTTIYKVAEIQYVELIMAADFLLLCGWFLINPYPFAIYRVFVRIGLRWALVAVAALALAIYGLNQGFYIENATLFKRPLIITVARLAELFLDIFYMIFLANLWREDRWLRRFAANCYLGIGVLGSVYSIASAFAWKAGIFLGGVWPGYRFRGFNIEGGPYGIYVVSVVFLALAMRKIRWLSLSKTVISVALLLISLIGSQSKSAFVLCAVFAVLTPALRLRGRRLAWIVSLNVIAVAIFFAAVDLPARIRIYTNTIDQYRTASALRPDDGNYVMGRVAGLFLAPEMIAARPWTGIGFGNYPLLRDDPQYRRGTPIVATTLDAPGLGPVDYIVDFGIPLFLFYTWVEFAPALQMLRRKPSLWLVNLALLQPIGTWFGAHLNLAYPWIAAAIALAITYSAEDLEDAGRASPLES